MKAAVNNKINRNDMCPCGSGIKYKKCCNDNLKEQINANREDVKEFLAYRLNHGLVLLKQNNIEEAEKIGWEIVRDDPFNDSALFFLAKVLHHKGELQGAVLLLNRAIEQCKDPKYYIAISAVLTDSRVMEINYDLGIKYLQTAIELDDKCIDAYRALGGLYYKNFNYENAKKYFQKVLELDPHDNISKHFLSAAEGSQSSKSAPKEYVENLFDHYAEKFDYHLVEILQYNTPKKLITLLNDYVVEQSIKKEKLTILDLGCGTGLCAEELRSYNIGKSITGVDLSSKMIEQAKAKNVYKHLIVKDIEGFLKNTENRYSTIISSDVFVYLGELANIFQLVNNILKKDGIFLFSVEKSTKNTGYEIRSSGRYAHSVAYIMQLAEQYNYNCKYTETLNLRKEGKGVIEGCVYLLKKL